MIRNLGIARHKYIILDKTRWQAEKLVRGRVPKFHQISLLEGALKHGDIFFGNKLATTIFNEILTELWHLRLTIPSFA